MDKPIPYTQGSDEARKAYFVYLKTMKKTGIAVSVRSFIAGWNASLQSKTIPK